MATANPLRKRKHQEVAKTRKETPDQRTRNAELPRRDVDPKRPWGREDFMRDLYKASARIVAEIDANPQETERLKKSQRDIKEGRVRWEDDDSDEEA